MLVYKYKITDIKKIIKNLKYSDLFLKGVIFMYNNFNNDSDNNDKVDIEGFVVEEKDVESNNKKTHKRFKTFGKFTSYAITFGLVAGITFTGFNYATKSLGNNNVEPKTSVVQNATNDTILDNTTTNYPSNTQVPTVQTGTNSLNVVTDISNIVENIMPSIVAINSTVTSYSGMDIFGRQYERDSTGSGSGIIIGQNDTEVLIVTNNHVIEGAKNIEIIFDDKTTATATVKGTDADSDLAVVAVKFDDISSDTKLNIKIATLGNSNELKVGNMSIAIGNALGYGQSVTVGYISALNREVYLEDGTMTLLQTDAAINPGNSGGALINIYGEVIGINSVKYSSEDVEGIGYAIPISDAIPIINDLMNREVIPEEEQAYLGITGIDITEDISQMYGMPIGACILQVTQGSPAEQYGLLKGDIILAFDDTPINSMEELQDTLKNYRADENVTIKVKRLSNGKYSEKNIKIKLGSKSNSLSSKSNNNVDKS